MIYTLKTFSLIVMLSAMFVKSNAFRPLSSLKVSARSSSCAINQLSNTLLHRTEKNRLPTNLMATSKYFSSRRANDPNYNPFISSETEMESRIKDAENWVSIKLTDQQSAELNRQLGIEQEVMDAIAAEENAKKFGTVNKNEKKKDNRNYLSKLSMDPDYVEAGKLKGFLETNPFLCPGCGTPFQSKAESNPGYLPKDMFQEHRRRSEKTKKIQEAVKLLTMAGIELDSPAAEELLRSGEVAPDIIAGVRKIAIQVRDQEREQRVLAEQRALRAAGLVAAQDREDEDEDEVDAAEAKKVTSGTSSAKSEWSEQEEAALLQLEEFDLDAYRNKYAKFNKNKRTVMGLKHPVKNVTTAERTSTEEGASSEGRVRVSPVAPLAANSTEGHNLDDDDAVCICQRCFRLQQYGSVESTLRPGWSANDLLTPERFESLLTTIKETPSVVLCIVDIFDLRGSILPNLRSIVGTNPIVIAANKIDLLPHDVSLLRVQSWIHSEIKQICGYKSPRDDSGASEYRVGELEDEHEGLREEDMYFGPGRSGSKYAYAKSGKEGVKAGKVEKEAGILRRNNVHLVSCQSGMGMESLLKDLMGKAAEHGSKIHVMGAANVGKSSFINRLLDTSKSKEASSGKKKSKGVAQATVSNLPGTTLDFIKMRLPNGITMIDTPGLLTKGQLTSKLNSEELRQIIPSKPINPITLRVEEGKCVLIGGVARVELIQGRPFFFTFFNSNEVKLHSTQGLKADDFIAKHVGDLVFPPASVERYNEIGPYTSQDLEITGESWKKSSYDIVIAGLGWVSVTGPGTAVVRVTTPIGTTVGLRPALLPYEAPLTTVKFSGGRLVRKGAVRRKVFTRASVGTVGSAAQGLRALRNNNPLKPRKDAGKWKKPGNKDSDRRGGGSGVSGGGGERRSSAYSSGGSDWGRGGGGERGSDRGDNRRSASPSRGSERGGGYSDGRDRERGSSSGGRDSRGSGGGSSSNRDRSYGSR